MKIFPRILALLCLGTLAAAGASYTWSGKGEDTQWSNPTNWIPVTGPPANGDDVSINTTLVELDSALTLGALNIANTTLSGSGSIKVTSQSSVAYTTFSLTSVTIAAPTDIYPSTGADVETAASGPFVNNSTITVHTGAQFIINSGAVVVNQGKWIFSPQTSLYQPSSNGVVSFINNGSLYLTNATVEGMDGSRSSILSNSAGGLIFSALTNTFNAPLASAGTLQTVSNSILNIADDGALYLYSGANVTGSGVLAANTDINVIGNPTVTGVLQYLTDGANTGGAIYVNGVLEIANGGVLNWLAGSLTGNGGNLTDKVVIDPQGTLNIINDDNGISVKNLILTNNGAVYWTNNGSLYLGSNAIIANSQNFYITGDSVLNQLQGDTSTVAFANSGTVYKIGGDTNGQTALRVPFNDMGSLQVSQGNLDFYGGGSIHNWIVSSNGALFFQNGTYASQPSAILQGGPFNFNLYAFINVPASATLAVPGQFFHAGTIYGAGQMNISGIYQWNAGAFLITNATAVTVNPAGVLNIEGPSNGKTLSYGNLFNNGVINWTNDNAVGGINMGDGGGIINQSRFNLQCDAYVTDVSTNANLAPVVYNDAAGVVRKTAKTGSTVFLIRFVGVGEVRIESGTIEFLNFVDNYPNAPLSRITLLNGTVQFDSNQVVHATMGVNGGITSQRGLLLSGGRLSVGDITLRGTITNDETFDLGYAGILTQPSGNFTQTSNGTMIVPIRAPNSTGYGKFAAGTFAYLGGTVAGTQDSSYAPPIGALIPFLTAYEVFSNFSTFAVPSGITVTNTGGAACFLATSLTPSILVQTNTGPDSFNFNFATVTNTAYTVERATNLPPIWTEVTNFVAQTTNFFFSLPFDKTNTVDFYRVGAATTNK